MKSMINKKNIFETEKIKSSNNINRVKNNMIRIIDKDEKEKEKGKEKNIKEKKELFKELTIDTRLNTIENRHIINRYIKTKIIKTEIDNVNTKKINNSHNMKTYTKALNVSSKNLRNLSNYNKEIHIKNSNITINRDILNITNTNKTTLSNHKEKKMYNNINCK